LAKEWAEEIGYPFPDKHRLARVAVYNTIESDYDHESAKRKYLRFLKEYLLDIGEEDEGEGVSDLAAGLRGQVDTLSFPEIANQLDYPRFEEGRQDPLRLLAKLPLSLYVTTSYYDFMERALQAEGRRPRTQICFLSGEPKNITPEHCSNPDIKLSNKEPLVYHLHGFERYPESLVLSEDDYIVFLERIAREGKDSHTPYVPFYLWEALAESSLVLLGYRLHDWDFRMVFLGLIKPITETRRKVSLAVQFDPVEQKTVKDKDNEKARRYLEHYFKPCKFRVEWGTADDFIKDLYTGWHEWEKKQA